MQTVSTPCAILAKIPLSVYPVIVAKYSPFSVKSFLIFLNGSSSKSFTDIFILLFSSDFSFIITFILSFTLYILETSSTYPYCKSCALTIKSIPITSILINFFHTPTIFPYILSPTCTFFILISFNLSIAFFAFSLILSASTIINFISAPIIFLSSFLSFLESSDISVAGINTLIPLKSIIAQVINSSFICSFSIAIIFPVKIFPFSLDELIFCHTIFFCNSSVITFHLLTFSI